MRMNHDQFIVITAQPETRLRPDKQGQTEATENVDFNGVAQS